MAMTWGDTLEVHPPVRAGELPEALRLVIDYMAPIGPMFPNDWLEMMALAFWSSLWTNVRHENLGCNLWFLGVNPQGVGKNITSDELYKLFRGVAEMRDQKMTLYTSGSAEGMARKLTGHRQTLLAYHAEYAGFLKSLRQMPGAKELLCNLYDGRDVSHQLATESVTASEPYVVVVATTTMSAITEAGNREDLQNGYLSRFLMCAPDSIDVGPEHFRTDAERWRLATYLADHATKYEGVIRAEFDDAGRDVVAAYRLGLGIGTGRIRNLDEERLNDDTPPGRLVARVKKVATLLALARRGAEVNEGVIVLTAGDATLAIRLTERANAYATRIGRWIGTTRDDMASDKVVKLLGERGESTMRELLQRTHMLKRDLATAMLVLVRDGEIVEEKNGQKVVYRLAKR